jgi:hypothetical protein
MMMTGRMSRWTALGALLLAAEGAGVAPAASAAEGLETQVNAVGETLVFLKAKDVHNIAAPDIQQSELWLGQAQAYVAADKPKEAKVYLTRAQFMNQFIQLSIEENEAKRALQETMDKSSQLEKDLNEVKQKLQTATERRKQLEAMGY